MYRQKHAGNQIKLDGKKVRGGITDVTSVKTNLLQRVMTRALEWFLIFLMIVLTAVVVIAVLYRIAGDSLSWYDEVAAVLLSWVT